MTPFSVFPLKTMRFQMSPFSNHSTLNSVFKCLRFRSFSMETPTQKRRHSTPFSYENGVMETGPNIISTVTIFFQSTFPKSFRKASSLKFFICLVEMILCCYLEAWGFLPSKGTWGCASHNGILFWTSGLAKGILFGNFSRILSRQGYAFWQFWSKNCKSSIISVKKPNLKKILSRDCENLASFV